MAAAGGVNGGINNENGGSISQAWQWRLMAYRRGGRQPNARRQTASRSPRAQHRAGSESAAISGGRRQRRQRHGRQRRRSEKKINGNDEAMSMKAEMKMAAKNEKRRKSMAENNGVISGISVAISVMA
jgi:hypothetical protein